MKNALESEISSLEHDRGVLVGQTNGTAEASLTDTHTLMTAYGALQNIEGIKVTNITSDQLTILVYNSNVLSLQCQGDSVLRAELTPFGGRETPDADGDFLRGLIENVEMGVLVATLSGGPRNAICPVVNELSFRVGRCVALEAEVKQIERNLRVRRCLVK